jgi:hypothetical protein
VRGFLSPETTWWAAHIDEDSKPSAGARMRRRWRGARWREMEAAGIVIEAMRAGWRERRIGPHRPASPCGADKLNRGASLFANARLSFFQFAARSVNRSWSPPFWDGHLHDLLKCICHKSTVASMAHLGTIVSCPRRI